MDCRSSSGEAHPRSARCDDVLILYGSETGTAQETAAAFSRWCRKGGFSTRTGPMNDYSIAGFPNERLVIFFVSTTGDGEAPENMRKFWSFMLRRDLPPDSLQLLSFAVFGFGDSSYAKYNAAARMLRTRLGHLGATELFPIGLADDRGDVGVD